MARLPNTRRSLEELDQLVLPPLDKEAPPSVARCHSLRKIPLEELLPADIRVLIQFDVGTEHLMPLALELLMQQPLIECEYYPGDLLTAALRTEKEFWKDHKKEKSLLSRIAKRLMQQLQHSAISRQENRQLLRDINEFLGAGAA